MKKRSIIIVIVSILAAISAVSIPWLVYYSQWELVCGIISVWLIFIIYQFFVFIFTEQKVSNYFPDESDAMF